MIKTELTNAVSTLGALQGLRLFLAVRKDPLRGFCDLQQKYGDFIRWKGPYTTYQLTHPADVQHVLQTNPGNYHKGRSYRISREYSAQRSWALMPSRMRRNSFRHDGGTVSGGDHYAAV
jgi:hypothetical protein